MPLIDLTKIKKTKISMLVGKEDTFCPHSRALETAGKIGDAVVNFTTVPDVGHSYFGYANGNWFVDLVKSQL